MKVGVLRSRVGAALAAAMRTREADAIALTADRAKAVGVALAGLPEDAEVAPMELAVSTRPDAAGGTSRSFVTSRHTKRSIRKMIAIGITTLSTATSMTRPMSMS